MVTNYKPLNNYAKYYTPGIVDITPSINNFLNVKVPEAQLRELDGISLIGLISVARPEANLVQGALDVSWKAMDAKGKVKIWVATANNISYWAKCLLLLSMFWLM